MRFVVLLGVVSLLADVTYEGARSISGPFLALLGASGVAVGLVAGFGELIGYGLRLVSGYVTERTGKHWAITIFGYAVNLLAVPALALADAGNSLRCCWLSNVLEKRFARLRATSCSLTPRAAWGVDGDLGCTKRWIKSAQSLDR